MKIDLDFGLLSGEISAPGSKSFSQRAIVASMLSHGESHLLGVDPSNDTLSALGCARALGSRIERVGEGEYIVSPCGERGSCDRFVLDIGESGLSTRLFAPVASTLGCEVEIVGHGSILTRPMDFIIDTLSSVGVRVSSSGGYLPLRVCGSLSGGEVRIDGSHGSQFVSGMLFAMAQCSREATIWVDNLKSLPYIDMTLDVLSGFGVCVEVDSDYSCFRISPSQQLRGCSYQIEGDWSGASCLLVGGAICGGEDGVVIGNLNLSSAQADSAIVDALLSAGADIEQLEDGGVRVRATDLLGFEFDATHSPDLFPALALLASACRGESVITGVSRLKHKESDRAAAIACEFAKAGVRIEVDGDFMRVWGTEKILAADFDAWNDHRIAMSTAILALRATQKSTLTGAESVNKSYPEFWNDLEILKK